MTILNCCWICLCWKFCNLQWNEYPFTVLSLSPLTFFRSRDLGQKIYTLYSFHEYIFRVRYYFFSRLAFWSQHDPSFEYSNIFWYSLKNDEKRKSLNNFRIRTKSSGWIWAEYEWKRTLFIADIINVF